VLISTQHALGVNQETLRNDLIQYVITPVLWEYGYNTQDVAHIYTNPTGIFNIGWPVGDSWLTGRKIIIDTYGGVGRHGWGAFSGKDPTKVDRSGAYISRYLAKNIVASWVCDRCEIQLSYAIGIANPTSIYVDTFGTNKVWVEKIIQAVQENFDLSPKWIITKLDLRKPVFSSTAKYGHFGREWFTWENLDSVEVFQKLLSK
jgi:S-adenosylmethionine synthetase